MLTFVLILSIVKIDDRFLLLAAYLNEIRASVEKSSLQIGVKSLNFALQKNPNDELRNEEKSIFNRELENCFAFVSLLICPHRSQTVISRER